MADGLMPTSADSAGQSTKAVKKSMNAVRDRSTNTAQLVLFILLDPKVKRDCAIIHYVSQKVDEAHAGLCRDLKSCEEVQEFNIEQAEQATDYLATLSKLLDPFVNFDGLKAVGFNTDVHSEYLADLSVHSEEYAAEAELAGHFMDKVVPAVGRLVRGHLQTGWTYPGKFLLLKSNDCDIRDPGMQAIKSDGHACLTTKKMGVDFGNQLIKRSSMNWVVVEATMMLLEGNTWQM